MLRNRHSTRYDPDTYMFLARPSLSWVTSEGHARGGDVRWVVITAEVVVLAAEVVVRVPKGHTPRSLLVAAAVEGVKNGVQSGEQSDAVAGQSAGFEY